jgi:formate/nitrite transporter FocA (FNT family)
MSDGLGSALRETVDEGSRRLQRTWPSLLATGAVGGIDVSIGLLAVLFVLERSGNHLVAGLAFGIGFIALTLANSELFTENFLLPVAAVAAEKATWKDVFRLWAGTASMNLVGGFAMVAMYITAFPRLEESAIELGAHFIERGVGLQGFLGAVIAGIVITIMTWMQSGSDSVGGRLVAAVAAAFMLSYGELGHVIVASLEILAGIIAGAPYGYADWFPLFWQMAIGNLVGGVGLVTILRLVQVGPKRIEAERRRQVPDEDERIEDEHGDDEPGSGADGSGDAPTG